MMVGDQVRLTGTFLRDTGQTVGGEGHKHWTIQACACSMCANGRWVAVDDEISGVFFTPDELKREPSLRLRHIDAENLEKCS